VKEELQMSGVMGLALYALNFQTQYLLIRAEVEAPAWAWYLMSVDLVPIPLSQNHHPFLLPIYRGRLLPPQYYVEASVDAAQLEMFLWMCGALQ
jgi:hypothetical protein